MYYYNALPASPALNCCYYFPLLLVLLNGAKASELNHQTSPCIRVDPCIRVGPCICVDPCIRVGVTLIDCSK